MIPAGTNWIAWGIGVVAIILGFTGSYLEFGFNKALIASAPMLATFATAWGLANKK